MQKRTLHFVLGTVLAISGLTGVVWLCFVFGLLGSPLAGVKSYDFGVVPVQRPSSTFEHIFQLTNASDHTLQLEEAVSTCGCTTTDLSDAPVPVGGELLIPVHLKLQKSQYRSSKVRLVFASGEVVVLSIEGTGRFTQPMQSMPPNLSVASVETDGTQFQLGLEWFKVSNPPLPVFITPQNVRVETEKWILSKEGDKQIGMPDTWTLKSRVYLDDALEEGSFLSIELENYPPLLVPLKQVEKVSRPSFM